jgi:hypothetical protein
MAKRKYKKRAVPVVRVGEMATPERRRQLGGVVTEVVDRDATGKVYMKRNKARYECIIDYYHDTYRLDDPQFMAAQKFAEMFNGANFGSEFSILASPYIFITASSDPEAKAHRRLDCYRHLQEIEKKILTPAQWKVVVKVCGRDERAGNTDYLETLRRALDELAKYWNYV